MELLVEGNQALITIRVRGALQATDGEPFRETVLELSNSGRSRIRIDLTEAPSVEVPCVGILVGLKAALKQRGGNLQVVNPQPHIRRMLELLRLNQVLGGLGGEAENQEFGGVGETPAL